MNLIVFIAIGAVFALVFALSLRHSTKGFKLFLSVVATALAAIALLYLGMEAIFQANVMLLFLLLILGIIVVFILIKSKIRLY